ncbi:MAG: hypothetical protein LBQ71_02365 [Hungatella sp.]|nr:hypothetical protein [Hungatella sp.]
MEHQGKVNRGGKTPIPYPNNWIGVYNEWLMGNLSTREASYELNIGYGTFYNMAKRYEVENGIDRERKKTARKGKSNGIGRIASVKGRFAYQARKYNDYIERNILSRIDYQKLFNSYYTEDMEYAKGIFNLLNQAMIDIYGNEFVSEGTSSESILIPGAAAGNGEICLVLLVLDLDGTIKRVDFLTEYGCCTDYEDMLPEEKEKYKEVAQRYTPYMCGYTVYLPEDNFNMNELPDKVKELLTNFENCEVRLLCDWNKNMC